MPQNAKIYGAAEAAAIACYELGIQPESLDGTVEAAQSYVDRISSSKWWYDNTRKGTYRKIDVRAAEDEMPSDKAAHVVFDCLDLRRKPVIELSENDIYELGVPAIADPWLILHEMAHVMVYKQHGPQHGREFTLAYLELVDRWISSDHSYYLLEGCRVNGVRIPYTRLPYRLDKVA